MTRRSTKVAVARGAAIALALLLAAACGQKSNVGPDTSAAPAPPAQGGAGGAAAGSAGSASGTADTVATGGGSTTAAPASGPTGGAGSSGAASSATAGRSAPASSGGAGAAASPSGGSAGSAAGSGATTGGHTPSSAARTTSGPAGGAGAGASASSPVPAPPAPAGADRTGVTDTKIRIGIHAPITGAAPFPQNAFDKGKDVYWKFLADHGGLLGRNVQIIFKDDQFNPAHAVQVCREMVEQDKVFMLFGVTGSDQVTACARYANSVGVPYLSGGVNED
ncbi:MAG TPA: ABC transporter substrate-binding protein, partial [Acidimicrobiia bacterium]|nr:ABC transporter substrate-binding protein [Acidimicrobiia bacterium]